ncbi:hypothetical protein BGZ93_006021 [Podila epicladia]|nr:hypothetical protein BGZ92_008952 [Podila epicladia]KAG0095339.1 hypothetical protein BGZ93_006021 [Podila epicladia]
MNSNETIYLTLGYIGIVLFLYLIGHCAYRGINYTLQIFCVVGIINSINETFLVFMHKGQVVAMAGGTAACTVSAIIEQFTPMALNLLATSMAFHIWFVIVWKSSRIELQMLKWYCLVSFGIPIATTSIAMILLRNEPHFSAYPRRYYCDFKESYVTVGTFAIPMTLWAIPGILLTLRTVVYLVMHHLELRRTLNTAGNTLQFGLGHCSRLIIFCFAFGMIMVMAMMERLSQAKDMESPAEVNLAAFSDFSGSLVGICVFIVFGTTRDSLRTMSIVFCPCRQHVQSSMQLSSDSTTSTGETQMLPRSSPRSSPLHRYSDYSLEDVEAAPVALKELDTEPARTHSPDYGPGRKLSSIGSQDNIMPLPP